MNTNEEKFYNNCFTEIEEGKVNSKFNKITMKCFDSENNKFSMDCEGNLVVNTITTREINNLETNFDAIYPVGSVYIAVNDINPSTLFGGAWEQIKGRFLFGCGENESNTTTYWGNCVASSYNRPLGETGGEPKHTLTIEEMPQHNHQLIKYVPYGIPYNDTANVSLGGSGKINYGESYEPFRIGNTGSGWEHNNMPPYLAVSIWKRVA